MHRTGNADDAGQAGRRIGFPNEEEAVAVAQKSEFLAVNQKIRVRIPAVTPFPNARDAEVADEFQPRGKGTCRSSAS